MGSYEIFLKHKDNQILPSDLLVAAIKVDDALKTAFAEIDIDKDDVNNLTIWYESLQRENERKKQFWTLDNLLRQRPIGKAWIYGYAINLERFSYDITDSPEVVYKKIKPIGKKQEIKEMELVLSKSAENNVLLV